MILHVNQGMHYLLYTHKQPANPPSFIVGLWDWRIHYWLYISLLVITGLHRTCTMIKTSLLANTGFNLVITLCAMYGFANVGTCLAFFFKAKRRVSVRPALDPCFLSCLELASLFCSVFSCALICILCLSCCLPLVRELRCFRS